MINLEGQDFLDEDGFRYVNPRSFHRGLVVARVFAPRAYVDENSEEVSAWLPEVLVCQPYQGQKVQVMGAGIYASSPAKVHGLFFEPSWNETTKYAHEPIFRFGDGFKHADGVSGDLLVWDVEMTGMNDNYSVTPGLMDYSNLDNRDVVLYGPKKELREMIKTASMSFPRHHDRIHFGPSLGATSDEEYSINVSEEDAETFAGIAAKMLDLYGIHF